MSETVDRQDREPISVYDALTMIVEQMSTIAWVKLGLQPDFNTGKIEKNIDEAKVAIDLVAYTAAQIEPKLDDEDRRRLQGLVRDLKINFVEKAKE
jgi:hypothetical protein